METQKNFVQLLGDWLAARQARRRATAAQPRPPRHLTGWLPSRGNVLFTLVMIALLVAAQTAGALPLARSQTAPTAASTGTIAYQGRLADAEGHPLTQTINMTFRLWDSASGGTELWFEDWTGPNGVRVSDGLFNVMLGSLKTLPQSVIAGRNQLFLGITVGTDDEMAPRVQLGSVPFAVQALTVPDGSVTTAKIADGAVTQAKLADGSIVRTFGPAQARIQYDSVLFNSDACDSIVITFPEPFPNAPIVVLTQNESTAGYGHYVVSAVTSLGFTVTKNGGTNCTTDGFVNWIAVGK